jgi:hypothetical protein
LKIDRKTGSYRWDHRSYTIDLRYDATTARSAAGGSWLAAAALR